MKNKVIIIGASAAGKSTLMKYLRGKTNLPLDEMDEMLTRRKSMLIACGDYCKRSLGDTQHIG